MKETNSNLKDKAQTIDKSLCQKLYLAEDTYLYYTELPVTKGYKKPYHGFINDTPCVIFRGRSFQSAFNYLIKIYSELEVFLPDERFSNIKGYTCNVIDCFVEHGTAYYFDVETDGQQQSMFAVMLAPLWETADKDLSYVANLIHYFQAVEEQGEDEIVFMDDYGLC